MEHGDGVLVLQVLLEVVVVEGDVVVAHAVQDGPGGLVAQDGGIALDEGVQVLLLNQVAGDALDLVRRAAVEGGHRHTAGDVGRDGVDVSDLAGEELLQDLNALLENGGLAGVDHAVQEVVDLLALDARQVVAHGHIEHEAVGVAQAVDLGHHFQGAPGLHIFLKGLLDVQLGRPLAVVALVLRQDAGTVDAGGQLRAVHLLDGLQLEKPGAAEVTGDDVLGQLGVGTGGGAEGGLDGLAEDGQLLHARLVGLVDTEHGAVPLVFGGDPGHQFPEGNGNHQFRHAFFLLKLFSKGSRLTPLRHCDSQPLTGPPIAPLPRKQLAFSAAGSASPLSPQPPPPPVTSVTGERRPRRLGRGIFATYRR